MDAKKQAESIDKLFFHDVALVYVGKNYQVWCELLDERKQRLRYLGMFVFDDIEVRDVRILQNNGEMIAEMNKEDVACYYPSRDEYDCRVWKCAWEAGNWPKSMPLGPR